MPKKRFYTQQAFTQRSFYTQQAFTHSKHETQQAFTHSKPFTHSKLTASFYTHSKHLHTASFHSQQAFTQRSFYKQKLSHTGSLYAVKPQAQTRYLLRAVFIESTSRSLGATTHYGQWKRKQVAMAGGLAGGNEITRYVHLWFPWSSTFDPEENDQLLHFCIWKWRSTKPQRWPWNHRKHDCMMMKHP